MKGKPGIQIIGDRAILDRSKVALFCSVKCPGKIILDTYDPIALAHRRARRFQDEQLTQLREHPHGPPVPRFHAGRRDPLLTRYLPVLQLHRSGSRPRAGGRRH